MTDLRTVAIDAETIQIIESVGEDLLRQNDPERGLRLLTLVLTWRSLGEPVPDSWTKPFRCQVDESAGMAEIHDACGCERCHPEIHMAPVVELNGYSRKAPCR